MAKESEIQEALKEIRSSLEQIDDHVHSVDKTLATQTTAFDMHTVQDEKMWDELKRMNDILATNTASLQQHMRRTELLEEAVMSMNQRLNPIELNSIKKEAIKTWVIEKAILLGKIIGAIAALYGTWLTIKPH